MNLRTIILAAAMVWTFGFSGFVTASTTHDLMRDGLSWRVSAAPLSQVPEHLLAEEENEVDETRITLPMVSPYEGLLALSRDDREYVEDLRKANRSTQRLSPRISSELGSDLLYGTGTLPRGPVSLAREQERESRTSATGGSRVPAAVRPSPVYVQYPGGVGAEASTSPLNAFSGGRALGLRSVNVAPADFDAPAEFRSSSFALATATPTDGAGSSSTVYRETSSANSGFSLAGFSAVPTADRFKVDTFFGSIGGWYSRDGEMTVSHNAVSGVPAGSLEGNFASQVFPIPQTDAFRLDSGSATPTQQADYLGNYRTVNAYPDQLAWSFDVNPVDVLPSDLVFQFSDGTSTFYFPFLDDVDQGVGNWSRVYIPLDYYKGWLGGSKTDFDNALFNVTSLEIQVTRSGTGSQSYLIDNFQVLDYTIPEPSTGGFLLLSVTALTARRWGQRARRRAAKANGDEE